MVAYPAGDFSWHHLWFLIYLFLYSIALVPAMTDVNNFQRVGAISNAHAGRDFEEMAASASARVGAL
jgi:hypothetical protein